MLGRQWAVLLQTHLLGSKSPPASATSSTEDLQIQLTSPLSMAPTLAPSFVPPRAARERLEST